jgi:3-oxoacyl-[acyl-carrier-protein] synthase-3
MGAASESTLGKLGLKTQDVNLVIPHQANLRIIEAVAKRTRVPIDRVYINIQRYGNMSAATVPVALCEALEEGRVQPGALLLLPGFGGGLSYCAHVVRWGERTSPRGESDVELPPNGRTALQIVRDLMEAKKVLTNQEPS